MADDLNITFNSDPGMSLTFTAAPDFILEFNETAITPGSMGTDLASVLAAILPGTLIDIDRSVANQITINGVGAAPPVAPTYSGYFGLSADRTIANTDFPSANSSMTRVGSIDAHATSMYAWFAVPATQGYPTDLTIGTTTRRLRSFEQLSAQVNDSFGVAHIVGVSRRRWAASISARTVTLVY